MSAEMLNTQLEDERKLQARLADFPKFDCEDLPHSVAQNTAEFPLQCYRVSTPVRDLLDRVRRQPDAPLLLWYDLDSLESNGRFQTKTWTYEDFASASRGCAKYLRESGIGKGDRVAIMCRNSAMRQAWQFGAWWLGAVEVSINFELTADLLAPIIDDAEPKLAILDQEFGSTLSRALTHLGAEATELKLVDSCADFPDFIRSTSEEQEIVDALDKAANEVGPEEMCSLIYTSGTTGPSKGVMLPAGYAVAHGHSIAHVAGLTPDDTCYFVTPFFHVDFHVVFSAIILSGGSVAIRPKFTASKFWTDVKHFRISWTWTVGFLFSAIRAQGIEAAEGHSLTRIIGAPVPDGIYEYFEDLLGINLLTLYGQTEADGPLYDTRERRRRGGAGWPSVGFDVQIHDDQGREVPRNTPGELVYRPQYPHMVMLGYWKRHDATVDAWRDLWMRSGDRAQMDSDGFVHFLGRMSDSIRRRGENVSAYELETVLKKAPGVAECAVVGVADSFSGEEEIKVFVVPAPPEGDSTGSSAESFSITEFESYCRENVPRYARPKFLQFTSDDCLVRSPGTQVIQKHRLLRLVREQEEATGHTATIYTLDV